MNLLPRNGIEGMGMNLFLAAATAILPDCLLPRIMVVGRAEPSRSTLANQTTEESLAANGRRWYGSIAGAQTRIPARGE